MLGVMIVVGLEGFEKNYYCWFNMKGDDVVINDDFVMMVVMMCWCFLCLLKEREEGVFVFSFVLIDGGKG